MTILGLDLKLLSDKLVEQGASWKAGDTSMTQLTLADAKRRLGVEPPPGVPSIAELDRQVRAGVRPHGPFVAAAAVGAPTAYDWRNVNGVSYVTDVRDQGNCGSCVAFGVVAVLESNLRVGLAKPALDIDLSEAHLFYGYGRSQGRTCSTGWSPDAALDQCANGLAFEQSFKYIAGDQDTSRLDPGWKAHYAKVAGKSALAGPAIKQWIVEHGPVTACFLVYDDFFAYQGGVYHRLSDNQVGGHCVSIVGYDDASSCWICKNSWGKNWGEQGFFRIRYGECGIDSWLGPYGATGVTLVEEARVWSGWYSEGGRLTSDIAAFANLDGRLEVFARGTDNAIWHNWQVQPSGSWAGWSSLGGVVLTAPTVQRNADGRLEVFAKGTDGAVWHAWQVTPNGGWSGWSSLGGVITSDISAAQNGDGRLEIFVRGSDGAVWHNWQSAPNGGWTGWRSLGGVITSDIAAGRNGDGRLEIFVRGTDGAVWHNWQVTPSGGWSGWRSLGGVITSRIAAARNADGRVEIFVRGTDSALWHNWQLTPGGAWSGWATEGGVLTSDPAVGRSPAGRLEVFVRGSDNALWHKWQGAPNGGWSAWASEGGVLTSDVTVASNADGRLEVFACGTDRALWHDWQTRPIAAVLTATEPTRARRPTAGLSDAVFAPATVSPVAAQAMPSSPMVGAAAAGMPRGEMQPPGARASRAAGTMPIGVMSTSTIATMPEGEMERSTYAGMPVGEMPPADIPFASIHAVSNGDLTAPSASNRRLPVHTE